MLLYIAGLSGFFPIHPMSLITAERNRAKAAEKAAAEAQAESEESTKS